MSQNVWIISYLGDNRYYQSADYISGAITTTSEPDQARRFQTREAAHRANEKFELEGRIVQFIRNGVVIL